MAAAPTERPRSAGRGRPQLHGDDEVLAAALTAFAASGYEAMSIRSLGRDLGLSHGALNQRFGSKERLYFAAVDHGFGGLTTAIGAHLASWPDATDAFGALRNAIRAFLLAAAERPELVRLMNTEGIAGSDRLDYVFERYVWPLIEPLRAAVVEADGTALAAISTRELFFLVTHGAAAPFTLAALSHQFDASEPALDPVAYADHMADVLLRTLQRP